MQDRIVSKASGADQKLETSEVIAPDEASVIVLNISPEDVAKFERRGDSLVLTLVNGRTIVIEDFFKKYPAQALDSEDGDRADEESSQEDSDSSGEARNDLVLVDSQGVAWWGQYPQEWTEFHFTEITSDEVFAAAPFGFTPIILGALGIIGAGIAIASGGDDNDVVTVPPAPPPTDNAPPTIVGTIDDRENEDEDSAINLDVSEFFSDADGDDLTFTATGLPTGLTIDPNTGVISGAIDNSASQDVADGAFAVTVTASDGNGGSVEQTFTWTVTNPAPEASDDAADIQQGSTASGNVLTDAGANDAPDTDPDGDQIAVSGFVVAGDSTTYAPGDEATIENVGTITIAGDGSYSFVPDADFTGAVPIITYTIDDSEGGTDTADLVITVSADGQGDGLTANDDSNSTAEDTAVSGSVAGNDNTTSGGTLSFTKASDPANGSVIVNPDGTYTYTPDANFNGEDSFTYTVTDSETGDSLTRTVLINVDPVADLTAADDSNSTAEDTPVSGSVAGNDSTTSGGTLTFAKASDPSNGSVTVNPDGSYTYTPDANFAGEDSFTYTVTDPESGESLTQTVTITVGAETDLTADDDAITTAEDTAVSASVAGNDSTTSGGALTFAGETGPTNGSVTVNADGTYTYTPNPEFSGQDSFTYRVTDSITGESLVRTVTVTVTPVNDPPVARGSIDDQDNSDAEAIAGLSFASFFAEVDGDTLTYSATGLPPGLTIDPATGVVSGTIDNSASQGGTGGAYSVTITADDGNGEAADQTFTWTIANPDPIARNDAAVTDEDVAVSGNVLAPAGPGDVADDDPDGDAIAVASFVVDGDPTVFSASDSATIAGVGVISIAANGAYTFTPAANFNGAVPVISYTIDDGEGGSATADLAIEVDPVVDLTAGDDDISTPEDTPVSSSVAGNDSTTSGGTLTFAEETGPSNGTVVVNADGSYTYTPDANFNGQDSFTYRVTDADSGESLVRTVTITVGPELDLTAADDRNTTNEDTPVNGTVAANDSTTSGGTLTFAKETDPSNGSVTLNSDGTYTYTPNAEFNGEDTFTYTVTDTASGESLTRTVTIDVMAVNDEPVLDGGNQSGAVIEAGNLDDGTATAGTPSASGTFTASDVENDTLEFSVVGTRNGAAIDPADTTFGTFTIDDTTGAWSFALDNSLAATQALNEGDIVEITYVIEVNDGNGGTDERDVVITITGANDAPSASPDTGAVTEAGVTGGGNTTTSGTSQATGNVLTNDTDLDDGETATLVVDSFAFGAADGTLGSGLAGTFGDLTLNADGSYTYILDNSRAATQALDEGDIASDVFSYTIIDTNGAESTSTLTITVDGTNDRPTVTSTASDATGSVTEVGSAEPGVATATGNLDASDVDEDADLGWTIEGSTDGTHGTIAIDPDTGEWTYTLDNTRTATQALNDGDTPTETFTARVTDENGAFSEQQITVTVNGSNDDLVGGGDETISLDEDATATGTIQNFVTDIDDVVAVTEFSVDSDGDGIDETFTPGTTVSITDSDSNPLGTLSIAANGDFTFTPADDYAGDVPTVTYTASETGGGTQSVTQTIDFDITKVADAPTLEADKTVSTQEDTSVDLDLVAPVLTDPGTGTGNDDNPERLGPITLSISGAGASNVTLSNGSETLSFVSGELTIVLTDASNIATLPPEDPAGGVYYLTIAEYEALSVNPAPEDGDNFTITVSATSFEVDGSGEAIATVPGATSTQDIEVDVQAVTDGATVTIDGGNSATVNGNEDEAVDVGALLDATLTSADANAGNDEDGSETYSYSVTGLPAGTVVNFGGTSTTVSGPAQVVTSAASTSADSPSFTITPPEDFSGDIDGISITLNSQDTDGDSAGAIATITDTVTLNLRIAPVAGDVSVAPASTTEDTPVAFLAGVEDDDSGTGSEIIESVSFTVPAGWTVTDSTLPGYTNTGSGADYVIEFDAGLSEADREAILDDFLILPPAHSSADVTIPLSIVTRDDNTVGGGGATNTQTVSRDLEIEVTPAGERIGTDTDDNGSPDVTMTPGHTYSTSGNEDQFFDLNGEAAFDLSAGWSNEDADEETFALLTPSVTSSEPSDTAIGTQFRYSTDGGATFEIVTFGGEPVRVPVAFLDTLEVRLPDDVSGSLEIAVQTLTVDTDPDTGEEVEAISGSATLSGIVFEPVAEDVTLSLNGRAVGREDTEIPLAIRVLSTDASEDFDLTIADIPSGATLTYDGNPLTISGGSVTIPNFDNWLPLSITPPPDSNVDFSLNVSAVSRDGGDSSLPASRTINVAVNGVADTPIVSTVSPAFSTDEETLDDVNANTVALTEVVNGVAPSDVDGSERSTLRITGLGEEFSLTGAVQVGSGTGAARVWVVSAGNLSNVDIVLPENYSGTVDFQVAGVATENDGDSLTGVPTPVSFTVAPSPEGIASDSATLIEDQVTPLDLALITQNGDDNEMLGDVFIPVGYDTTDYEVVLGATPLASAGLATTVIDSETFFVVPAAQVANLGAITSEDLDGTLVSLPFRYEVVDPSNDGTLPPESVIKSGSLAITAQPVTDEVDAIINAITLTSATGSTADNTAGDDANPDTVTVNTVGALTVNFNVTSEDVDGSEQLVRILIEDVPDGVTVANAAQIGVSTWLLVFEGGDALSIGPAGVDVPVEFVVSTDAANALSTISMTALAQDRGNLADTPADIETDTVSFDLDVDLAPGPGPTAPFIDEWSYNGTGGAEDTPSVLGDLIDAEVSTTNASQSYNYTVTLRDLPDGSTVTGMIRTVIGGEEVFTASVGVGPGEDSQAALDALLASITITAPADANDNNSNFDFQATLAASAVGGRIVTEDAIADVPIEPVTDPAQITVDAEDVDEGAGSLDATITVSTPADGANGTIIGGNLYVQVTETNNAGGTVSSGGMVLTPTTVSGVAGVPDGDYFVIDVGTSGGSVDLTYTAASGEFLEEGDVTFTAFAQSQEVNAANVETASASDRGDIAIANNGVTATSAPVTGDEAAEVESSAAIELVGLSVSLVDDDGSEVISSILLSGLPVGFQVLVGPDAASATQADNAGGDGVTNTWVLSEGGPLPAYVAILPPANWSGELTDLALQVQSGETVLRDTRINEVPIETVTIEAVANGVDIDPSPSFGREGSIIDLNLNASMADAAASAVPGDDSVETTTIEVTGLGEFAEFFVGTTSLSAVSYDGGTDTYTITGLTQDDLDDLGFVQAAAALTDQDPGTTGVQVAVDAFTVESENGDVSAVVSEFATIRLSEVPATTGADAFLFDGGAIDGGAGLDRVLIRSGEDIDHTDLASLLDNIEIIDLGAAGANSIEGGLSVADVQAITGQSAGSLQIDGDSDDSVELSSASEWTTTGVASGGFVTYTNSATGAVLEIHVDINVSFAV